jgi:hypothetical protein
MLVGEIMVIPSENATRVFTAQLEEYWYSKDSKSFQDYLYELVAQVKASDPSISSALIADKFNVNKSHVDQVLARLETERKGLKESTPSFPSQTLLH